MVSQHHCSSPTIWTSTVNNAPQIELECSWHAIRLNEKVGLRKLLLSKPNLLQLVYVAYAPTFARPRTWRETRNIATTTGRIIPYTQIIPASAGPGST